MLFGISKLKLRFPLSPTVPEGQDLFERTATNINGAGELYASNAAARMEVSQLVVDGVARVTLLGANRQGRLQLNPIQLGYFEWAWVALSSWSKKPAFLSRPSTALM